MATLSTASVHAARGETPNFESSQSAVHWSAIIGGAVVSIGVTLILLALGAGLGLSAASPWARAGASAAALGAGAAIWIVLVQWIASAFGGYFSGRLRTKWANMHSDEVLFRDTAHGFLAWALATLVGLAFLSSVISGGIGAATSVASSAAQGAAQGAAQQGAATGTSSIDYVVDQLFRTGAPAPAATGTTAASPGTPAATAGAQDARAEAGRILLGGLASGSLAPEDRTYLAQLVAARTGTSQADAEKRVDDVMTKAKQTADAARKAAATLSLTTALSMLIGAFIAAAAGALGGRHRDEL
jgi:hypothetical protein